MFEDNAKRLEVVLSYCCFDYQVIDITFHVFVQYITKYDDHRSLVRGTNVFQTEGYNFVIEDTLRGLEDSMNCIFRCHLDLIIP